MDQLLKERNQKKNSKPIYDLEPKIVIIGEAGVGKTSLFSKFLDNSSDENVKPTLGIECRSKIIEIEMNDKIFKIKARLWDTAGQERYKSVTSVQLRKAVGALVVYDITKKSSFEKITEYIKELPELTKIDTTMVIVGNKLDLVKENPTNRNVSLDMLDEISGKFQIKGFETSAFYEQDEVNMPFLYLLKEILKKRISENGEDEILLENEDGVSLSNNQLKKKVGSSPDGKEKKKGCC